MQYEQEQRKTEESLKKVVQQYLAEVKTITLQHDTELQAITQQQKDDLQHSQDSVIEQTKAEIEQLISTHFQEDGTVFTIVFGVLFPLIFLPFPSDSAPHFGSPATLLPGLIMLLAGLLLLLIGRDHPAMEIMHHYYTALEQQNYTTAFQYVNILTKTPQNLQMTQDRFISREQRDDHAWGKRNHYKIIYYSLGWKQIRIIIEVTREPMKYREYVTIRKGDMTWKISSFDFFRSDF